MQRVDFFKLERPIQERFVAAARGAAPPVPLSVVRQGMSRRAMLMFGASVVSVIALFGVATVGFGQLSSSWALQPEWVAIGYAVLAAASVGFALAGSHRESSRRTLPFAPGVYLFPSGVIDTRDAEFVVRPLSEISNAIAGEHRVLLSFEPTTTFAFPVPNKARAEEILRTLKELRERLGTDFAPVSARELSVLDPLCDNGFKNPFSPVESMRRKKPRWVLPGAALGLACGALAGWGAWKVRNVLAESALYRAARAADSRAAYLEYVARGGKNSDVREILLPRTELLAIVQKQSIDELHRFAQQSENARIKPEVDAALHLALARALTQATQAGTFSALKEFRARYAAHSSIAVDLDRAMDARLKVSLAEFERRARPKPEVRELFRRLFAHAKHHDGRVELRFRRRLAESVPRAEALLEKSLMFGGKQSLPAQYFDDRHAAKHEDPIAKEIVSALSRAVPDNVVTFEIAPPLKDSSDEFPRVEVPTLLITHRTEMSGAYLMKRPKAALTGVGVLFRISFQIPGDATPYAFKYSSWNAPDVKSIGETKSFEEIYGEMTEKAFGKLAKKYLADLLPGIQLPPKG